MSIIRPEVASFMSIGPLPKSRDADVEHVQRLTDADALAKITPPISKEEAIQLASAFGPDDCFGLAWSLVHLIESAPDDALDAIPPSDNQWLVSLRRTAARSAAILAKKT